MRSTRVSVCLVGLTGLVACTGTTGGEHTLFAAAASGPSSAADGSLTFTNSLGYRITLSRARLHVGAIYLNQSVPSSGSQQTSCILPGIYVGQVIGPLEVDALSVEPQSFPFEGDGTGIAASAAELWLTGGDVNTIDDSTVILDTAGIADKDEVAYPFEARLTIGRNRLIASSDPALPGANPICKQRIVTPIAVDLTPMNHGTLRLTVDPSGWFGQVDFSTVAKVSDDPLLYRFTDSAARAADISLYNALHARAGVYRINWQ
jgi:hypothetical protein